MLLVPVIAVVLFVALVAVARALRTGYRKLAALLARHMGVRAARATGLVLMAALAGTLVTGVLWDGMIMICGSVARAVRGRISPTRTTR